MRMDCTYLLRENCQNSCARYGINLAACSLGKSLRRMDSIIDSGKNPIKILEDIKPYMLSIHDLSEGYAKENHWNGEQEEFQSLMDRVLDNGILSIGSTNCMRKSYKDTKKSSKKEVDKLKVKIGDIIPRLDYFLGLQF